MRNLPLLILFVFLIFGCDNKGNHSGSADYSKSADYAIKVAYNPECIQPNENQREKIRQAVKVLEIFDATTEIYGGAALFFMRSDVWICHEDGIDERAAFLLAESGYLARNIRNRRLMSVAHRLASHDARIEAALADIAFQSQPVSSAVSTDVRPEALSILASLGAPSTSKYKQRAVALMGAENSVQIGAAQLAASSGDPKILVEVAGLLEEVLPSKSGSVLKRPANKHVVELSYALLAGGQAANPYLPVLDKLLEMKVESASHFGVLEVPPSGGCRVYKAIGTAEALDRLSRLPCSADYDWWILPQ